jgi:hypothetical protein
MIYQSINKHEINKLVDVIVKFFGERGLELDFPRKNLTENAKP